MSDNSNMNRAKKARNDEFYTRYEDIETEVSKYREHFSGKTVYCNCDDPDLSNFPRFFTDRFGDYGLKRLIATCHVRGGHGKWMTYDGKERRTGILAGDGDFRSEECLGLLRGSDIAVTNVPFSLLKEYIPLVINEGNGMLIIGNVNTVTYKEVFPLIKEDRLRLGYTKPKLFGRPDGSEESVLGICRWFTTLPVEREPLALTKTYKDDGEKYPKYDNYDAINVDKVSDIPLDYEGVMGAPITFLDKYCPEQFEIVGVTNNGSDSEYDLFKPFVKHRQKYARVLIRRR